jgi:restriction system protein
MSRRYAYRRRSQNNVASSLILVGVLFVGVIYAQLSPQMLRIAIVSCFALAGSLAIGVFLFGYYRNRARLRKMRALEIVDTEYMDGLAFEKYVAELLRSQGYAKVTLTERYDLGVDIIAVKDGVRWGIQVKRYSNLVKAEAVRQVVTALNQYKCQRAMVVTNSTFSRPARILAESNDCVLIGRDEIADWIIAFQEGKS